jgi:hypothetical protein
MGASYENPVSGFGCRTDQANTCRKSSILAFAKPSDQVGSQWLFASSIQPRRKAPHTNDKRVELLGCAWGGSIGSGATLATLAYGMSISELFHHISTGDSLLFMTTRQMLEHAIEVGRGGCHLRLTP